MNAMEKAIVKKIGQKIVDKLKAQPNGTYEVEADDVGIGKLNKFLQDNGFNVAVSLNDNKIKIKAND